MAQDSEKRFHSIMDKLFHAPKSTPSSTTASSPSAGQSSRGKKRQNSSSDTVLGIQSSSAPAGSSDTPLCRPWDRGDLMRRLATFKSMTWFAKPKVVSAVNCARRGWINVDMDIIACEACGARILFSTPSSWNQQEVEKAALVFSLKLGNGHKILCPWVENACDEALAEFPPTPPPALVENFRERCSALARFIALPVISSSAIEYMRSPQLEHFLEKSSLLEFSDGSTTDSIDEHETDSAKLYYQVLKIISLCGWEPRSLPYVVYSEEYQSVKTVNVLDSFHFISNGHSHSVNLRSADSDVHMEEDGYTEASNALQFDPKSVVLDCKLCGASVGLWAFHSVPKPVEVLRLVGYSDLNRENSSGAYDSGNEKHIDKGGSVSISTSTDATLSKDRLSKFNITIAGGPPPTEQNFKATISLPVIGRNLMARLSFDSDFRDRYYGSQEQVQSESQDKILSRREDTESTLGGECSTTGYEQSHSLSHEICGKGDITRKENDTYLLTEGTVVTEQGTSPESQMHASIIGTSVESAENVQLVSVQNDQLHESLELDPSSSQVSGKDVLNDEGVIFHSFRESSSVAAYLERDANVNVTSKVAIKEGKSKTDDHTNFSVQDMNQEGDGAKDKLQTTGDRERLVCSKEKREAPSSRATDFDPIRQHRYFCPWIASTNNVAPGWQQTLSALQRQKGFSPLSPMNSPSASIIKVDDPMKSVRKLFTSSAKRLKSILAQNTEH